MKQNERDKRRHTDKKLKTIYSGTDTAFGWHPLDNTHKNPDNVQANNSTTSMVWNMGDLHRFQLHAHKLQNSATRKCNVLSHNRLCKLWPNPIATRCHQNKCVF